MLPLTDNLTWAFNQPDNKAGGDDCIQIRIMQNATGIALYDRNCSDKYVIACEVNCFFGPFNWFLQKTNNFFFIFLLGVAKNSKLLQTGLSSEHQQH
jgi:hypothetical protein